MSDDQAHLEGLTPEEKAKYQDVVMRLDDQAAIDILRESYYQESLTQVRQPFYKYMYIGRKLYEKYEKEIDESTRYIAFDPRVSGYNGGLRFKDLTLMIEGDGWNVVRYE